MYLKHYKAKNCEIILLDRQFCVWPGGRFWGRRKEQGEHLRYLTANPMWVMFCSELCCLNLKLLNICFMPGNLVFQTLIYMITLLNSFFFFYSTLRIVSIEYAWFSLLGQMWPVALIYIISCPPRRTDVLMCDMDRGHLSPLECGPSSKPLPS